MTCRLDQVIDPRVFRLREVGHQVRVRQGHPFGQAGRPARVRQERHVTCGPGGPREGGRVDGRADHLAEVPRAVRDGPVHVHGDHEQRPVAGLQAHQPLGLDHVGQQLGYGDHAQGAGVLELVGELDWNVRRTSPRFRIKIAFFRGRLNVTGYGRLPALSIREIVSAGRRLLEWLFKFFFSSEISTAGSVATIGNVIIVNLLIHVQF